MFNIGDIVRIKSDSAYYGRDKRYNPADVDGEVLTTNCTGSFSHNYRVMWTTGVHNIYREKDLELIKPPKPIDQYL